MTIDRIVNGKEITLKIDGWLDVNSANDLGAATEQITEASAIILDFEKVEYISSAGLRQVVASNKKAKELGADFSVIKVTKEVMSIFELTGLHKKINVIPADRPSA